MKFEFATVEVKKFDLEDVLTASANDETEAPCWDDFSDCPANTELPCPVD